MKVGNRRADVRRVRQVRDDQSNPTRLPPF